MCVIRVMIYDNFLSCSGCIKILQEKFALLFSKQFLLDHYYENYIKQKIVVTQEDCY